MNNTFSLQQISQTDLDSILFLRQYKLDLMARFPEIKYMNPRLRQDQKAKELDAQVVLYNDIDKIWISFHVIESHLIAIKEDKRFQIVNMTSKDLNWPQSISKESFPNFETVKPNTSKKNKFKGGANIEINDKY